MHLLSRISNLLLLSHNWLNQSLRNWRINHLSLHDGNKNILLNSLLFNYCLHLLELLSISLLIHRLLPILELLLVRIEWLDQCLRLLVRLYYLLLIYWVLDNLWLFHGLLGHLLDGLLFSWRLNLINWLLYLLSVLLNRLLNNLGCHLDWLFNSLSYLLRYRLLDLLWRL